MPINDLQVLSSPVPPPAAPGSGNVLGMGGFTPANQAMLGNLSAGNTAAPAPTLPVGSGQTMYGANAFSQEEIGAIGGVVGLNDPTKVETFIPPEVDIVEEQTSDFAAADAGIDGETYTGRNWRGKKVEVTGKKAARKSKKADRQADRDKRKDAGLKGGTKRRARRSQRKQRKASWKNYKSDAKITDSEF